MCNENKIYSRSRPTQNEFRQYTQLVIVAIFFSIWVFLKYSKDDCSITVAVWVDTYSERVDFVESSIRLLRRLRSNGTSCSKKILCIFFLITCRVEFWMMIIIELNSRPFVYCLHYDLRILANSCKACSDKRLIFLLKPAVSPWGLGWTEGQGEETWRAHREISSCSTYAYDVLLCLQIYSS